MEHDATSGNAANGKASASRPRYPSDERHNERRRRERRPSFFKVHCSISNHPRTAGLFADNELFAGYVRLGLLCIEKGAAQTSNEVTLTSADLLKIFACEDLRTAQRYLHVLCKTLAWRAGIKTQGRRIVCTIEFRNLAKKQGITP